MKIAAEIGIAFPPRTTVDEADHAARVLKLAKDCADINPVWLDAAAQEWTKSKPFFPRACELREAALAWGKITRPDRLLASPKRFTAPKPVPPPLSDDEIRKLPQHLIELGISVGDIDPDRAQRLGNYIDDSRN